MQLTETSNSPFNILDSSLKQSVVVFELVVVDLDVVDLDVVVPSSLVDLVGQVVVPVEDVFSFSPSSSLFPAVFSAFTADVFAPVPGRGGEIGRTGAALAQLADRLVFKLEPATSMVGHSLSSSG